MNKTIKLPENNNAQVEVYNFRESGPRKSMVGLFHRGPGSCYMYLCRLTHAHAHEIGQALILAAAETE